MIHQFDTKLAEGAHGEKTLDELFSGTTPPTSSTANTPYGQRFIDAWADKRFSPMAVSHALQRSGIDRYFNDALAVEYKTDAIAGRTHNAFIETVSVDTTGKQGWVYTSRAHVLAYYVPDDELVYIVRFSRLREHLDEWLTRYPERIAKNEGYVTKGICVPLVELERCSDVVVSI